MVCHTHTHTHTHTRTHTPVLHSWNVSTALGNVVAIGQGSYGILLTSNHGSNSENTQVLSHILHMSQHSWTGHQLVVIAWNTRWCPERTPLNECHVLQHVLVWSMSIKHESIEVTFHMFGATLDGRPTGCIKSQSWMHITPTIPV